MMGNNDDTMEGLMHGISVLCHHLLLHIYSPIVSGTAIPTFFNMNAMFYFCFPGFSRVEEGEKEEIDSIGVSV